MTTKNPDIRVRIIREQDPMDPRDWTNLGTLVCWHKNYELGDEQPSATPEEYRDALPKGTTVFPLYLYDHSGISLSMTLTYPYIDAWDAGQVGFVVVTPERQKEVGTPDNLVSGCLEGELATYNQYLAGDVWGYLVEVRKHCDACGHDEWEHVDSCWGFFGSDPLENGIGESIGEYVTDDELATIELEV